MATQRQNKTNKKVLIRDTAANLFLQHGYRGTTMDVIADAMHLNKGTLYFYYKSKAELLYEIFDLCGTLIVGRTTIDDRMITPIEGIKALVKGIIQTIYEHQVETTVYFRQEPWLADVLDEQQFASVHMKQKAVFTNCRRVFERAIKAGEIRNVPIEDCFHVLLGVTSWAHRWIKPTSSPDDIAERLSAIFIDGLRAR